CFGDEPWRFVICNRNTNETAWQNAFACLTEGNRGWAVNAPVLILVCANNIFSRNDQPNRWAQYDTGAASMSICLQATSMGLMVHQMGGYDSDKSRDVFSVPEQFTTIAMMAVGYQFEEDELPEGLREREMSERHRSDLGQLFFDGTWGSSIGI
ncbi:MAG: nitroreductase family protein, partial [Thiotrichales bacterium]|nr:nitroreductase family protein [Thiotrichales bacterium]